MWNRGISLYIAIVIMAILLAIVLGVSAILVGQMKMIRGMENSVIAFYATDTGIEEALKLIRKDGTDPLTLNGRPPVILDNQASYSLEAESGGSGTCTANIACIRSVGSYRGTNRAIEIEY